MNKPKGKLIAIGGNEDKGTEEEPNYSQKNNLNFFALGILKRIAQEAKGKDSYIEVVTTASTIPVEVGFTYLRAFIKAGCNNIGLMHIKDREDVKRPDYIKRISEADVVMFSGGNQLRLSMIFGGTTFLQTLRERYQNEDFVIAGTSAGAMAMSGTMIYLGSSMEAHLKGAVKITTGLGLINNVIIDSHFDKRGRFGRLAQAVASNPDRFGLGLGEDTGVLITGGNHMEVIGSGMVIIIDGQDIAHSNIADIPVGSPISVENVRVHFLARGDTFELNEKKFTLHSLSI